jgi:hypothetical protein
MLVGLVLVCSTVVAPEPRDCTNDNARVVMRVPAEFGNPATCLMQAQAYLAGTSIGQELGPNERLKIMCVRKETIAASTLRQ